MKKDISTIYMHSDNYDEFIEQAVEEGYEQEEAEFVYDELNWKYTH